MKKLAFCLVLFLLFGCDERFQGPDGKYYNDYDDYAWTTVNKLKHPIVFKGTYNVWGDEGVVLLDGNNKLISFSYVSRIGNTISGSYKINDTIVK